MIATRTKAGNSSRRLAYCARDWYYRSLRAVATLQFLLRGAYGVQNSLKEIVLALIVSLAAGILLAAITHFINRFFPLMSRAAAAFPLEASLGQWGTGCACAEPNLIFNLLNLIFVEQMFR